MMIVYIFVNYIVPHLIVFLLCLLPLLSGYSMCDARFRNCTNDTLYIGASHYNSIDSLEYQVTPWYYIQFDSTGIDTAGVSLWKKGYVRSDCFVLPDSACDVNYNYLFQDHDTCYFFLIKYSDAKHHSWDEIRKKKLYKKWFVTRKEDGTFDRDIRYLDSDALNIIHDRK